jgi:hypothetical protein
MTQSVNATTLSTPSPDHHPPLNIFLGGHADRNIRCPCSTGIDIFAPSWKNMIVTIAIVQVRAALELLRGPKASVILLNES